MKAIFKLFYGVRQRLTARFGENRSKHFVNLGWLFLEKFLGMAISFFVGVYLIRYLSSAQFGTLSFCLSVISIMTVVARLGLNQLLVRELVKQEDEKYRLLGTGFFLRMVVGFGVYGLLLGAAQFGLFPPTAQPLMAMLGLLLPLQSVEVLEYWFEAKVLSRTLAISRTCQTITISSVRLYLIFIQADFFWIVATYVLNQLLNGVSLAIFYTRSQQKLKRWQWDFSWAKSLLSNSWPLILSGGMITIYLKTDQIMLGEMSGLTEVGLYAAAAKLSEVWYFLPGLICSVIFPAILRARERSQRNYHQLLQDLFDYLALVSWGIVIFIGLGARPLVLFLFGQEYAASAPILLIHVGSTLFVFLGVARSQWTIAENHNRFHLLTTTMGAIVNIVLNYFLIPLQGGVGAAIATLISYGVTSHLGCFVFPFSYRMGWMLTKALVIPLRWGALNQLRLRYLKSGYN